MSTKPWRCCKARRFALQLAGTGVFGGSRPHSLWVGAERHPDLVQAARQDRAGAGPHRAPPEQRQFAPHVTLARLRDPALDGLGHFLAVHAQFRADPLPVEHFSLIASFPTKAGSVYEDQADYPLTG